MPDIGYLGNAGHRLPGPDTSINQVSVALMGAGNAQIRRPFPQFGNVSMVAPMWGNSSYQDLNIKVERRFSHGLNFQANYTFAKFIDDVPAAQEIGSESGGVQNSYNRKAEKALSGNDIRNRFVVSSVYELPLGKGKRWLAGGVPAAVAGGWSLTVIGAVQQGAPMQLNTQTNGTNAFTPGAVSFRDRLSGSSRWCGDHRSRARASASGILARPVGIMQVRFTSEGALDVSR